MQQKSDSSRHTLTAIREVRKLLREMAERTNGGDGNAVLNGEPVNELIRRMSALRRPSVRFPRRAHNPVWADWFSDERAALRTALAGSNIVGIEHIGSTAIPSLTSCDMIDIAVMIEGEPDAVLAPLAALGYESFGASPFGNDVRWTWKVEEQRAFVIHVGLAGCRGFVDALAFRDYLRAHPKAAQHYEDTKRALARDHAGTFGYSLRKLPVLFELVADSHRWRAKTGADSAD